MQDATLAGAVIQDSVVAETLDGISRGRHQQQRAVLGRSQRAASQLVGQDSPPQFIEGVVSSLVRAFATKEHKEHIVDTHKKSVRNGNQSMFAPTSSC